MIRVGRCHATISAIVIHSRMTSSATVVCVHRVMRAKIVNVSIKSFKWMCLPFKQYV